MPTLGNHETYSAEAAVVPPRLYLSFFPVPPNGPAALRGRVYSFDYGDAHFAVLDSQVFDEKEAKDQLLEWQKTWLEEDLAATDRRWKLVFIHRPLYHNRAVYAGWELQQAFAPVLDRHRVDVVFAGHEHVYARSFPIRDGVWRDEAEVGTVYFTTGRSGERRHSRFQRKAWDAAFYNPLEEPNYLTVEVSERELRVKAFTLGGEQFDAWRKLAPDN